jgi:RNA polymerase sigma-70 factor (ECF subfamily)
MAGNDSEICRAIVGGDPRAEEELVHRFQDRVRRMVEHALSRGPDCEDLTSEILSGTLMSLRGGTFRGDCRLSTFVHAVARNKIREHLRRRRPVAIPPPDDIPDSGPGPEEAAERTELAEAVRGALAGLRPRHREVLYLFYIRGLSVGEIAATLDVPARRVSEWKEYALKVLRARSGSLLKRFR